MAQKHVDPVDPDPQHCLPDVLLQRAALDQALAVRTRLLLRVAVHPLPVIIQPASELEIHAALITIDVSPTAAATAAVFLLLATSRSHRPVLALHKGQAGQLVDRLAVPLHHVGEQVLLEVEGLAAIAALEVFRRRLRLFPLSFGTVGGGAAGAAAAALLAPHRRVQIVQQPVQKVVLVLYRCSSDAHHHASDRILLGCLVWWLTSGGLVCQVDLRL